MDLMEYRAKLIESLYREEILDYQFGHVMAIQDENDPNFVVDVTSIFCEDAQKTIHELSLLMNQPTIDFATMEAKLQKLRGGSSCIGAHRVNRACVEFLGAAQASNREGCLHALKKLMTEYQVVHGKFEIIVHLEQKIRQYEMKKKEIARADTSGAGPSK